jgi:hypothetical protein
MPMKKMLLVFCFLTMASVAASASINGTYQLDGFCDGINIHLYGVPQTIFGGTHLLADCVQNTLGGGFRHDLSPVYQTGTGAVLDFSDPLFGMYGENSSLQIILNVNHGQCSWVIYYGNDGVGNYVLNAGTCTKVANKAAMAKRPGLKSSTQR